MPNPCELRNKRVLVVGLARTGVARIITRLTAYVAQTIKGSRIQVMPGARRKWMVAMKLTPVRIDEKPTTNTPMVVVSTAVLE